MSKLKIHRAESPRIERKMYPNSWEVSVDVECGQAWVRPSRAVDRWPAKDSRVWKHSFCKKCAWRREGR